MAKFGTWAQLRPVTLFPGPAWRDWIDLVPRYVPAKQDLAHTARQGMLAIAVFTWTPESGSIPFTRIPVATESGLNPDSFNPP